MTSDSPETPETPETPESAEARRCAEAHAFQRAHEAFCGEDLAALEQALGRPAGFPNVPGGAGIDCSVLQYALYHSPLPLIEQLLDAGADPNYDDHDGFPSVMAALSGLVEAPGASPRPDVPAVVELLLAHGAHPDQRGVNDYTPLHFAASLGRLDLLLLLLAHGADPCVRTRIDDFETPREVAGAVGSESAERLLADAERTRPDREELSR
ncbi:MAG: hypothetical protein AVDCRST_MAG72-2002 [uncultured Nocardioidaceae bacterium]|uniref:Uncharacterized protein n=1 Tax=uncultured Nocardioidaceae bacterium TaxID=253824 RepID=A0A6J4MHR2_9ACTN|nr:MAG: hypothetical protein AVDCRST_MAG72-2002 [uncultured Nocardioidaceae bacterium]